MTETTTILLTEEADVRTASNFATQMAAGAGFNQHESAELALAVSEIAQNVLRYAKEGSATFTMPNGQRVMTVTIADEGPGIVSLSDAMKKGFSTGKSSLGIGLDVAKRSVDEFLIDTEQGRGTKVTMKKFLPIPEERIEYGVVSMADERYAINGDEYLIKEYDGDKVLLAVIDGVGEGYRAHASAMVIKEYLANHYRQSVEELIKSCHALLLSSDLQRGAAVSLAKIESKRMTYIGIGDTHAYLVGYKTRYLMNQEGTVGELELPTLKAQHHVLNPNSLLIMCTDGIKSNLWFDETSIPPAQTMANQVFNKHQREYGDVTVLATKILSNL